MLKIMPGALVCVAIALATTFIGLAVVGWRPVAVMVGETLFLLLLVLGAVLSVGVGR
jgi:hypothetical protein